MVSFVKRLFTDFVDLVYPNLCMGCRGGLGPNEAVLCVQCRIDLPVTNHHLERELPMMLKFRGKVPIRYALSYLYFSKEGIAQKLVHQIKYSGQKEAGTVIGRWYGEELKIGYPLLSEVDYIVGVPLHKARLQQRGYNQADWIGQGIAEGLAKPFRDNVLIRTRFSTSQTRKNRLERYKNVANVFAVMNPGEVAGKHVVIVDDVLTTGATIETCAEVLFAAGCKTVGILTIAATR